MTTIIKLTLAELKRLLPNGCRNVDCRTCPFDGNNLICDELIYLYFKNQ